MTMLTRARRELRERQQLEQVAKPILCRRDHHWRTVERAVYRVSGNFDPAWVQAARDHALRVLHPDENRLAYRMKYAAGQLRGYDFGQLWAMAEHDPWYAGAA